MKIIKRILSTILRINAYGEEVENHILSEAIYNENGHRTSFILFTEDGEIESKSMFEVSEEGNILSQIHYERRNDLIERTDFFDTEEQVQYKTEITAKDGTKTIHEYKYNQLGNTDQIIIRHEDGSVEGYEHFKFDDQGKLVEEIRANADLSIQFRKKISYNDGYVSKEDFFDDKGRLQREITYRNNENGLVLSKLDSNLEWGTLTENKYAYDPTGNQIVDETFENGKMTFRNECHYDDENNLIEERIIQIGQESVIEIIHHDIVFH
jgi:hypothetical protein